MYRCSLYMCVIMQRLKLKTGETYIIRGTGTESVHAYFDRFKAGKYKKMSKWSLQVMQPHAGDLFNLKNEIQQWCRNCNLSLRAWVACCQECITWRTLGRTSCTSLMAFLNFTLFLFLFLTEQIVSCDIWKVQSINAHDSDQLTGPQASRQRHCISWIEHVIHAVHLLTLHRSLDVFIVW